MYLTSILEVQYFQTNLHYDNNEVVHVQTNEYDHWVKMYMIICWM